MKIALFHGTEGSPTGNWFPWLKSTLEPVYTVHTPQLPTPDRQNLENWMEAANRQIPNLSNIDIVIGHSCGASFIPHLVLAQKLLPQTIILVSPFEHELGLPKYDVLNQSFFLDKKTLASFRAYIGQHTIATHIFHGDNDPYVPIDQAKSIARQLNISLNLIKDGGHLNAEFGFTSFPDIINVI